MRVAIIHEWLEKFAGAEKVLEQLLILFPDAELFTLVDFMPEKDRGFLKGKTPHTSFIQKLPLARGHFRRYLPLFPMASEGFDLADFDLVLSSSYAFAKGVLVGPHQLHISYCHSPIRYAWDMRHQYLRQAGLHRGLKFYLAQSMLNRTRLWDAATAQSVDQYIANSGFVAARIKKFYHRDSEIIHPPVDISTFSLHEKKEDFYFTASRMVPYKKIDMIVEAFRRMPDKKLVVIGDGPEAKKIRRIAAGCRNVEILGYQPDAVLKDHMQRAKAFVFAAEEDFGIVMLEAQASGTPVLALGAGGALEAVRGVGAHPTGMFFREQTPESLMEAVQAFEARPGAIRPEDCRAHAEQFSPEIFRAKIQAVITKKMHEHHFFYADRPASQNVA